jgi:hypothetical protein
VRGLAPEIIDAARFDKELESGPIAGFLAGAAFRSLDLGHILKGKPMGWLRAGGEPCASSASVARCVTPVTLGPDLELDTAAPSSQRTPGALWRGRKAFDE